MEFVKHINRLSMSTQMHQNNTVVFENTTEVGFNITKRLRQARHEGGRDTELQQSV